MEGIREKVCVRCNTGDVRFRCFCMNEFRTIAEFDLRVRSAHNLHQTPKLSKPFISIVQREKKLRNG